MLYRYNLKAAYSGHEVFDGNFSSINQLVKFACSFDSDVTLESYDCLFGKVIPIYTLVSEFQRDVNGI